MKRRGRGCNDGVRRFFDGDAPELLRLILVKLEIRAGSARAGSTMIRARGGGRDEGGVLIMCLLLHHEISYLIVGGVRNIGLLPVRLSC